MSQYARPISDISNTSFVGVGVTTTGSLYQNIDETTQSNTDFIYSTNNVAATYETGLSTVSVPGFSSYNVVPHVIQFSYAKTNAGVLDNAGNAVSITIALMYGGATLASNTYSASGTWTNATIDYYPTSQSAFPDYANLKIRVTNTASGGSPSLRRGAGISYLALQVPDADVPKPRRINIIS